MFVFLDHIEHFMIYSIKLVTKLFFFWSLCELGRAVFKTNLAVSFVNEFLAYFGWCSQERRVWGAVKQIPNLEEK